MTKNEFTQAWMNWEETHGLTAWTPDSINDFCNIYATNYEEYMSMWHELTAIAMTI